MSSFGFFYPTLDDGDFLDLNAIFNDPGVLDIAIPPAPTVATPVEETLRSVMYHDPNSYQSDAIMELVDSLSFIPDLQHEIPQQYDQQYVTFESELPEIKQEQQAGDDVHTCERCGFLSQSYDEHLQHFTNEHAAKLCTKCGAQFEDASALVQHECYQSAPMEDSNSSFSLPQTEVSPDVQSSSQKRKPGRKNANRRPMVCFDCGLVFFTLRELQTHEKTHRTPKKPRKTKETRRTEAATARDPNICDRCGRDFLSKSSLVAHLKRHDTVREPTLERTGPCNRCKFNFGSSSEPGPSTKCDLQPCAACALVLCPTPVTEASLESNECGKRFSQPSSLTYHKRYLSEITSNDSLKLVYVKKKLVPSKHMQLLPGNRTYAVCWLGDDLSVYLTQVYDLKNKDAFGRETLWL
ncbi:unnamed protein product [Notodromas monacha]|uniref:C2H2-type domain-containing protein n=1 Tax=Notodromas monacha TaxID=399045 RepID=A0A7R9BJB8_9CRUS|nr:unnamed protein product [Notodromas monacha]CAG0915200.1 unnamed protein product [Notodromas monacha]